MDLDLNPDDLPLRSELTDEQRNEADQAEASAFALAFGEAPETVIDSGGKPAADTTNPAAADPAPTGRAAPTEGQPAAARGTKKPDALIDDPFKDLSPQARELLAEVPTLKRDHEALKNRLVPTQRKLAETERLLAETRRLLAEREAPAAPAAPSELETRVRGELPEVVDLIKEQLRAHLGEPKPKGTVTPEPAANSAASDEKTPAEIAAEDSIRKVHPQWERDMMSADFKLYAASRGAEYNGMIMSTDDPVVVASALTEFKANQRRAQELAQRASETGTLRKNRAERATESGGHRPPPGDAQLTEHDAMIAAFNSP